MKNKIFIAVLMTLCVFTGCAKEQVNTKENMENANQEQMAEQPSSETDFPGTYTVPEGWVKSEEYSTADKLFYVEEGYEGEEVPDNISINVGKNKYSEEQHTAFREAILKQLLVQVKNTKAELNGTGTYTEQGYPLYIFTITEQETGIVTEQYYIVGDHKFCLVHLTNYTQSETANEAAKQMVDSFVWN